jgi:type I restriction enzyme R subunit
MTLSEADLEAHRLSHFRALNYQTAYGPTLAPGEPAEERAIWDECLLRGRLREAIDRLNPGIPAEARSEALYLHPLGEFSGRGPRNAPEEPCGRAAPQTA